VKTFEVLSLQFAAMNEIGISLHMCVRQDLALKIPHFNE